MPNPNNSLLAKSVDDLVQQRIDAAGQDPIVQPPEDAGLDHDPLVPGMPGTMGGGWQTISRVGTGVGEKKIPFSKFAGGFNPSDLHLSNLGAHDTTGTPNRPRQFSAIPVATSGAPGEGINMLLTWYPPLTDTVNRWMTSISFDTGNNVQFADLIESYLISRKDLGTGEEAIVGVVSHGEQLISAARAYLEAEFAAGRNGADTDMMTFITVINPSFMVDVEDPTTHEVLYQEPFIPAHEAPFTYVDNSAVEGHNYVYYIQAITPGQVESKSASCIPGATQYASGLDVSPSVAWGSSYPDLTGSNTGTSSFVDIAFNCGSLVTGVEVSLVPIQDDALVINTAPQPDTDPLILKTDPDPIKLQRPASGTNTQTVTFIGRNLELWGGITGITFDTGITFSNPGVNLTKTRIGTTDDYTYVATVTVGTTATLGIKTMTVALQSGNQAQHSTIEVIQEVLPIVGPTLDQYGKNVYVDMNDVEPGIFLTGTNLDKILSLVVSGTGATLTITSKTPTELEATYSGSKGGKNVTCNLVGGAVSTGKDTFRLFVTQNLSGDPNAIPKPSGSSV